MNGSPLNDMIQISISIFFVFNSIGQIPVFIAILAPYEHRRQKTIIVRELLISLLVLLLFTFFGDHILHKIGISKSTIGLAGGLLLFLISLNLIFPKDITTKGLPHHEPLIVPLAIPGLAGPGSIAAVMLYATQSGALITSLALLIAWIPSFILLLAASYIKNYLGDKGVQAVEKLGGMIICLIGIQMVANGIIDLVKENFFV